MRLFDDDDWPTPPYAALEFDLRALLTVDIRSLRGEP